MIRTVCTLAVVATLSACASAPDTAKLSAPTANSGLSGDTPVGLVDMAAHKMAGTPADYDLRARALTLAPGVRVVKATLKKSPLLLQPG